MDNSVARVTEISAKSAVSFEDAVKVGLARATRTLRGVTGAWVKEQKVEVKDGKVTGFIVHLMVTFILDE
jgi:flavin-binding protein dodecin